MKILLFRTDPSIMNIANYNSQEIGLAKAYVALGHQCDIVYYNGKNPSRKETIKAEYGKEITIFWWKGFSILNNGIFPGITKLIKEYDVIQVSEYYFFSSWYVYKRFGKEKKVYIYQGVYDSDNSERFKLRCKVMDPILLNRQVLQNIQVFTKSDLAKESMDKRGFQKIKTVGVGLDTSRFMECDNTNNTLFAKQENTKYLLYVGVLEDRRNILFLLDVFSKVAEQRRNVYLVIIGRGKEEYVSICKERIKELKLEDRIIYQERMQQDQLPSVYRDCDIFLLPSKYEIFGMVLLEAMRFGIPVISSRNGGSSTLITSGETGFIIDDFEASSWSNQILKLLDDNKYALQIAQNAQRISSKKYMWSEIAQDILNTLDNSGDRI